MCVSLSIFNRRLYDIHPLRWSILFLLLLRCFSFFLSLSRRLCKRRVCTSGHKTPMIHYKKHRCRLDISLSLILYRPSGPVGGLVNYSDDLSPAFSAPMFFLPSNHPILHPEPTKPGQGKQSSFGYDMCCRSREGRGVGGGDQLTVPLSLYSVCAFTLRRGPVVLVDVTPFISLIERRPNERVCVLFHGEPLSLEWFRPTLSQHHALKHFY